MHAELVRRGVDTVWFREAAELNRFFGRVARFGGLLTAGDYLNDLGEYLYKENLAKFRDLERGRLPLRGSELDNHLVDREQQLVTAFTSARFGTQAPIHIQLSINLGFSRGRTLMPDTLAGALTFVESNTGTTFNYFDEHHRRELGKSMMRLARESD